MTDPIELAERFADAFNASDLAALTAMLSAEATAKVLGSDLPEEVGPETISRTSLAYLLSYGDDPLVADVWRAEDGAIVLLREATGESALDTAIRVRTRDGRITRLEYVVRPHRPAELERIARDAGIGVAGH